MRIQDPSASLVATDRELAARKLPLPGARVLELGCGRGEATRALAAAFPDARFTAMEVDAAQHALNVASDRPANLRFAEGGAQAIPAPDASFEAVLMLKSLHHVPAPEMARALAEVRRVLVPGGLAYIAEPVFAGELNEITRLYHDEERVRALAFVAIEDAVRGGVLELVEELFYLAPVRYPSFADFVARHIAVTHTEHRLSDELLGRVRRRFEAHLGPGGALFHSPMRLDLLRRPDAAVPGAEGGH